MSKPGRFLQIDGRPAVRFERIYPHPIDHVWAAVSEPGRLAQWFPSKLRYEPRVGGIVTFTGDPHMSDIPGTVLAFDPPREFAFTWGSNEVHLTLASMPDGSTRLTLSDLLSDRDEAARNASGWTMCLGELDRAIAGMPSEGPHSAANQASFQSTYDSYVAAGLPHGAAIPD